MQKFVLTFSIREQTICILIMSGDWTLANKTKHYTAGHSHPTFSKTREITEQKRESSVVNMKKF